MRCTPYPKGPKIEKIQDRPPGLKFSIEIENFMPRAGERDTRRVQSTTKLKGWHIWKIPGESPDKSGKSRTNREKDNKRTKKEGQVQIGEPPLRAQRLKKIKILKFSSEIENFKRATQQTPIFLWGIQKARIENFNQD